MAKIVISSNTSWSIYNFRLGLVKALKEKGYEVTIVAPKDGYTRKLVDLGFEYHDIFINGKGTNPLEDLVTVGRYCKIYKNVKPSIALHFTVKPNIYGNVACKLLKIPVISTITGLGTPFVKGGILTFVVEKLYRLALRNSSYVFFQNKDDFELFSSKGLVNKSKCEILPGSGINVERFRPISSEEKGKSFRFLLIARLIWDKGIGEYVEAARMLKRKYKNVEFCILGPVGVDNPNAIPKEVVKSWENEGVIRYLGVSEDVREEIAASDCVVLPSYYREGIPRVLLEAAAMEKPIITTDSVGCREVVDDGVNGFLCKVKDAGDLANKMEMMLNLSEGERAKMGKAGREKVIREFDERIVIGKYLEAIERILSKRC